MKHTPVVSAETIEVLLDDVYVAGGVTTTSAGTGRGYPDGVAGADIPRCVARLPRRSYDAMFVPRHRPHRRSRSAWPSDQPRRTCSTPIGDGAPPIARQGASKVADLQAAADQAAVRIDAGDHLALRRPEDAARAEYRRILLLLRQTRLAHPEVSPWSLARPWTSRAARRSWTTTTTIAGRPARRR